MRTRVGAAVVCALGAHLRIGGQPNASKFNIYIHIYICAFLCTHVHTVDLCIYRVHLRFECIHIHLYMHIVCRRAYTGFMYIYIYIYIYLYIVVRAFGAHVRIGGHPNAGKFMYIYILIYLLSCGEPSAKWFL